MLKFNLKKEVKKSIKFQKVKILVLVYILVGFLYNANLRQKL